MSFTDAGKGYFIKKGRWVIGVFILLTLNPACQNNARKIKNLQSFAMLYGYVRWFHPSDEAQEIDWNKFAVYGAEKVENAPDKEALRDSLLKIFSPIAPTLEIYTSRNKNNIHPELPMPKDTAGFKPVAWQHLGVYLGSRGSSIYQSNRTNRIDLIHKKNKKIPQLLYIMKMKPYLEGKQLRFTADIKTKGIASIYFGFILEHELMNILEGKRKLHYKEFSSSNWNKIKMVRSGLALQDFIVVAVNIKGKGPLYIDNLFLDYKKRDKWQEVSFFNQTFDEKINKNKVPGIILNNYFPYKVKHLKYKEVDSSNYCILISQKEKLELFSQKPQAGEFIIRDLSGEMKISLPLVLWGNKRYTYPKSNKEDKKRLKDNLENYSYNKPYDWLGSIIVSWNVFQHFYPYHNEIDLNWEKILRKSLYETTKASDNEDFEKVIRKMVAKLRDGHTKISLPYKGMNYYLPVSWQWIEDKLVITHKFNDSIPVERGDIVNKINNINARKYFSKIQKYIPAPTIGYLNHHSQLEALSGTKNVKIKLTLTTRNDKKKNIFLRRNIPSHIYFKKELKEGKPYKKLKNNILYFDLTKISYKEIKKQYNFINQSNGIIFDMRGYPNYVMVNNLLQHLLKKEDTITNWMKVPKFIYPDREKTVEYNNEGWQLKPKSPHIRKPVVFLTNHKAVSNAESLLLFVKYYKLGTIIGQTTAGTNGSVNIVQLPIGSIRFTGMKVIKFDGKQHFARGVQPDIIITPSLEGIYKGKDEYLEKAIQHLNSIN